MSAFGVRRLGVVPKSDAKVETIFELCNTRAHLFTNFNNWTKGVNIH